jgi:hypothetical protein
MNFYYGSVSFFGKEVVIRNTGERKVFIGWNAAKRAKRFLETRGLI